MLAGAAAEVILSLSVVTSGTCSPAVAAAAAAAAAGDAPRLARSIQPWLDALPTSVDLPWLYWSDDELAELQDEDTIAEAQHLRGTFDAACQVGLRRLR